MKRKVVVLLLGGTLALGMFGASAQAMTYAYEAGETEEGLSEEEKQKLEDWHREEMRQQIAYLEKFGISYDGDTDTIYYQGKTVRWLIDEQIEGTYTAIQMPEGEIDVYTERAEDYQLTGLRVATQEEYDERTRKDEAEKGYYFKIEDGEYISAEADGVIRYTPADGSVIHTYVEEDGVVLDLEGAEDSSVAYIVNGGEDETASGDISFRVDESVGEVTVIEEENAAADAEEADEEEGTAIEASEGFGFGKDDEEWGHTQKEYEDAGISLDSASGSWMWQGKPIHFLMDEKGSMYQNGSEEAKANKIYILVTRNEDGSIAEVKQVTMEEVLKERIYQEAEKPAEKKEE